jgi:hypothetical protein
MACAFLLAVVDAPVTTVALAVGSLGGVLGATLAQQRFLERNLETLVDPLRTDRGLYALAHEAHLAELARRRESSEALHAFFDQQDKVSELDNVRQDAGTALREEMWSAREGILGALLTVLRLARPDRLVLAYAGLGRVVYLESRLAVERVRLRRRFSALASAQAHHREAQVLASELDEQLATLPPEHQEAFPL